MRLIAPSRCLAIDLLMSVQWNTIKRNKMRNRTPALKDTQGLSEELPQVLHAVKFRDVVEDGSIDRFIGSERQKRFPLQQRLTNILEAVALSLEKACTQSTLSRKRFHEKHTCPSPRGLITNSESKTMCVKNHTSNPLNQQDCTIFIFRTKMALQNQLFLFYPCYSYVA